MQCPFCNKDTDSKVVESRSIDNNECIRRRRECLRCSKRFTTYERIKEWDYMVIKKNNIRELFDIDKLKSGIFISFKKRSVNHYELDNLVHTIEQNLRENFPREVHTKDIGKEILKQIKRIDEVAYIRFASVYREFNNANQFIQEIDEISKGEN